MQERRENQTPSEAQIFLSCEGQCGRESSLLDKNPSSWHFLDISTMLGALGAPWKELVLPPQSFVLVPQQQLRSKPVGVTWKEEATETPGSMSEKWNVPQFLLLPPHRSNRLEKILPQKPSHIYSRKNPLYKTFLF